MLKNELERVMLNEALARCTYEIYAEEARQEGLHYIAKIFEETSRNELSHVREIMKALDYVADTKSNLKTSLINEKSEANDIYPKLKELATADNDMNLARFFQQLAKIEERHHHRFQRLLDLIEKDQVYKRQEPIKWKCRTCGYIHEGVEPPNKCPGCQSRKMCFEPEDFSV